jgi:hypothetical protein
MLEGLFQSAHLANAGFKDATAKVKGERVQIILEPVSKLGTTG